MEKEKFLGNKALVGKGTGLACGGAVVEFVIDWKLLKHIKAISYDTCPINTGSGSGEKISIIWGYATVNQASVMCSNYSTSGACLYIERGIGKPLMWFPCVHHILELIVGAMVQQRWPTGGPRDAVYTRFKNEWPDIRAKLPDIVERGKEKV